MFTIQVRLLSSIQVQMPY